MGEMLKILLISALLLMLSACGVEESKTKQYFDGEVISSLNISGKDKIKSVSVKLSSGESIHVFVEQDYFLPNGKKIQVFKYEDSVVHYLVKK